MRVLKCIEGECLTDAQISMGAMVVSLCSRWPFTTRFKRRLVSQQEQAVSDLQASDAAATGWESS